MKNAREIAEEIKNRLDEGRSDESLGRPGIYFLPAEWRVIYKALTGKTLKGLKEIP